MNKIQCENPLVVFTLRLFIGIGFVFLLFYFGMKEYSQAENGYESDDTLTLLVIIALYLLSWNTYLFYKRLNPSKKHLYYLISYCIFVPSMWILMFLPFIDEDGFIEKFILSFIFILNGINLIIYFISFFEYIFIKRKTDAEDNK